MMDHPTETQVSTIAVVGDAVLGWESNIAVGVWMQPSQEGCHLTDAGPQSSE